jgi:autotransporter-associated beta strand protein
MDKQPTTPKSGALSRLFKATISPVLLAAFILLLSGHTSQAGSATWRINPVSGDWNTATNWTAGGPPNGPADTATFQSSNVTDVLLSADTEVDGIVFGAGASAFTITAIPRFALTISGVGITNNSGIPQNFVTAVSGTRFFGGSIRFLGDATAGNLTAFTNNGGTVSSASGGFIRFSDRSTAGNGTFTNNGGAVDHAFGGFIEFSGSSTAGNGTFTNNGSPVIGGGGSTRFFQSSTAGNATLIANGNDGGELGPSIFFHNDSSGGTARVKVFGTGFLDISVSQTVPVVTIGSIEGDGNIFLGGRTLAIGSKNLSTRFSGVIQDGGGGGGTGGSLRKIGTGVLIFDHRNTYTGGTTINGGKLVLNNKNGSGTGTGPVQVNRGRLGGRGTIAGDVTVGDGSGRGAALSPGNNAVTRGTLTIQSTLTFNPDATYNFWLNTSDVSADEVVALGVTINSGAQFSFADFGGGVLAPGTVFTVINNTAATPIAGTFSNLPDGSTFISNGNSYQVNYEGGDGNDLTLTVVP